MEFFKIHGSGNDFVAIAAQFDVSDYKALAMRLCDRKRGIGADGLVVYESVPLSSPDIGDAAAILPREYPPLQAIWRLCIYNSDGSQAETCGNALRAFTILAVFNLSEGMSNNVSNNHNSIIIQTMAGVYPARALARDIAEVILPVPKIVCTGNDSSGAIKAKFVDSEAERNDFEEYFHVDAGVPHAVVFVEGCPTQRLEYIHGILSRDFPQGVNTDIITHVNDVKTDADDVQVHVLVRERGAGPTGSCGTGACSVFQVMKSLDIARGRIEVIMPGGRLTVTDMGNTGLALSGEAAVVYAGETDNDSVTGNRNLSTRCRPVPQPRIRAAMLLIRDRRVLLVRHKKEGHQYWLLPGGGVRSGEYARYAAERELKEETGIVARAGELLLSAETIDPDSGRHIFHVIFRAEQIQGDIKPSRDTRVVAADFVSVDELKRLELRPALTEAVIQVMKGKKVPDSIHHHPAWIVQERK